ncbi:MAG: phosphodiesterase [Phycisphaerales bacterium]|nr:phosphodiesterase [Phycisphaerales bacterium]
MKTPTDVVILPVLGAALAVHAGGAAAAPPRVGIGDAMDGSVWAILAPASGTGAVQFEVAEDAAFERTVFAASIAVADALVPGKVRIDGLDPARRYHFRAAQGQEARLGAFRPAATSVQTGAPFAGARFGVTGDWRGDVGLFTAIANVPGRDLGFFVKLGDTVYADVASPAVPGGPAQTLAEFRAKHVENYAPSYGIDPWGALASSVLTFATIDDHEVTNNFSGGARGTDGSWYNRGDLFVNGLQAFVEHNPMSPEPLPAVGDPRTDGRPDLFRSFRWGQDAAVFMVDTRSFRDVNVPAVANPFDPVQVLAFLQASFNPARTMLSQRQLGRFLHDLEAADRGGATWKFVMTSVPFQNFGPLQGEDRWEGYAAERAFIMQQIALRGIRNVVFVTADFHGTIVNDITVPSPSNPQQQLFTGSWEIITGSVAYSAPAGPTLAQLGLATGAITAGQYATYLSLPTAQAKDAFISGVLDAVVGGFGYSPVGLQDPSIDETFEVGGPVAVHHYGWTEFDVDPVSKRLTVTTYGVDWYTPQDVIANPDAIIARPLTVRQRFSVAARPLTRPCIADLSGDGRVDGIDLGIMLGAWGRCGAGPCAADVNLDGVVNGTDLGTLLGAWGSCSGT